ncbi:MAG: PH domain-containing protein [Lachnospiraceae bacterium]|nr:PH domain-containing protein [Lachnospiraceae bacterium]MBQ8547151.1 PH domain-containing protein [Lachnospiraceae bacterium]MBQ8846598.1 PH domain-containing protein [Lachnospiraceae bacterium]
MADTGLPQTNQNEILWRARKRLTFFGLPWTFTVYRLTKDRLFIKQGFFTTREDEVRLYRILDISLKRTLIQKIFGLGTIQCHSSDKTMGHFEIINIKRSYEVKNLLSDLIEKERMEKRVSNREFISDPDCDFDDDNDLEN